LKYLALFHTTRQPIKKHPSDLDRCFFLLEWEHIIVYIIFFITVIVSGTNVRGFFKVNQLCLFNDK
jgi:hypothetical protein